MVTDHQVIETGYYGGLSLLHGFATVEGTGQYAAEHADLSFQNMGSTGLTISAVGFGGYRIDISEPSHRHAMEYALLSGINLIDTSANYADGGSERLIGTVLADLVNSGRLCREAVVIVSKGGYLQGENYRLSQQRKVDGHPFSDIVEFGEEFEHCIHPSFLTDQLMRSLQRLGVERVDCYLLHNPEYYLKWAKRHAVPFTLACTEYLRRIREAFLFLEDEVARGRIGCYGISSNTFPLAETDDDFSDLSAIWALAERISPRHHFRVIEFPCNLFETDALLQVNQPDGATLLEFAKEKNLATLINRPLNAIQHDELIRLADNVYRGEAAAQATAFRERVAQLDPAWNVSSLSQLAVRALRSTRGITAVLVGMRQPAYVDDILRELRQPCAIENRHASWEALAG